jgi:hypothetical protein
LQIGHKNDYHSAKSQPIKAGIAQGMILGMAVSSAMSPYVRTVVVLMYFTKRSRIEVFDREIELSDWPKISENQGVRTTAYTAAAERIGLNYYYYINNKASEMPRSPPEVRDHVTLASKYIGVLYKEKSKK